MNDEPGSERDAREVTELREREARYRDRLSNTAERLQRLRGHTAHLLGILRDAPPRAGDLTRTLTEVARVSRTALGVERASVWMFEPEGERLECLLQLDGERTSVPAETLSLQDCPAYARALASSGVLAVEDTLRDPRMSGLEAYLGAHGVTAMLDISIAIPGERRGVVCHEDTHGPRPWLPEEIDFATHVGNLIALALEVERRHAAEAKILSAEARYRYLVESLPVTVYSFDAFSNRLDYLSPQFSELTKFEPDALLAHGVSAWLDMIHEDDRSLISARFAPHGVDTVPAEVTYRVHLPGNRLRFIRDQCRVVRNHAGDPVAIQGVLADVTEARLSEQRAAEHERRLRNLLENVELIGMMLDRKGQIEYVNPYFVQATGHQASEVLGVDGYSLLIDPAAAASSRERFLRNLWQGHLPARFENEIVARSGERRRVVWTTTILRSEDGTPQGSCSLGLDVTERVRFEAELLQQTKLESLGQLSAGVAHDFNNLLTVMSCEADNLARTHRDPSTQRSLGLMHSSLKQASELTRSLLIYARRDPVSPAAVAIDALIEESMPLLGALAGKRLVLTRSLHAAEASALIDPTQLRQVLMNLVGNAIDATGGHGGKIAITTSSEFIDDDFARDHGASQGGRFVAISVADDGRGMDRRTLSRVFEPFFTTKPSGRGTGLGLAMCDSIMRRARGFITVDSEPGAGTTCRAYLPMLSPEASAAAAIPQLVAAASAAARPAVLVVEDEPVIRKQIELMLAQLPLTVQAVATVTEARRVLANEPVDLLITDGSLSDGLGRILAENARAARPSIRVLLVSGAAESSDAFDASLPKPFSSQKLIDTVRLLLPGLASS